MNINQGGSTWDFDADIFIEPIVSYKIKSDFDALNTSCLGNGKPFRFINKTTPLLFEGFNPLVVDNVNDDAFEWTMEMVRQLIV